MKAVAVQDWMSSLDRCCFFSEEERGKGRNKDVEKRELSVGQRSRCGIVY